MAHSLLELSSPLLYFVCFFLDLQSLFVCGRLCHTMSNSNLSNHPTPLPRQRVPPFTLNTKHTMANKQASAETFGLSLGNEYMCFAVWDNSANVVVNADGDRTTPACVAFGEHEVLVGNTAKTIGVKRPKEVVHSMLYVLGNLSDASAIRKKKLGFDLDLSEDGEKVIGVVTRSGIDHEAPETKHTLVEAISPLFKFAKGEVEANTGSVMKSVVVTLPHYICNCPDAVSTITQAASVRRPPPPPHLRSHTFPTRPTGSRPRAPPRDQALHRLSDRHLQRPVVAAQRQGR